MIIFYDNTSKKTFILHIFRFRTRDRRNLPTLLKTKVSNIKSSSSTWKYIDRLRPKNSQEQKCGHRFISTGDRSHRDLEGVHEWYFTTRTWTAPTWHTKWSIGTLTISFFYSLLNWIYSDIMVKNWRLN